MALIAAQVCLWFADEHTPKYGVDLGTSLSSIHGKTTLIAAQICLRNHSENGIDCGPSLSSIHGRTHTQIWRWFRDKSVFDSGRKWHWLAKVYSIHGRIQGQSVVRSEILSWIFHFQLSSKNVNIELYSISRISALFNWFGIFIALLDATEQNPLETLGTSSG